MTLLAPAFLAGLLAIGLPWWLHRLSTTNPNRRAFSSLMFLEPGEPHRVLAKKVQYWLLLALRIAFLVLLALVFAQPAWLRSPFAAAGEDSRLHLIVVDASASMSHDDRWARASGAARDVLEAASSGDRAQLVSAGRVAEIVTDRTDDLNAVREALATLSPTPFRVDYGRLTQALDGVIRNAELPVMMHFITDVQQTALPPRFTELAPGYPAEIVVHDVSAAADQNWALVAFTGSPLTGELEARVQSFSDDRAEKIVRLDLDGQTVAEERVTIEPHGVATVEFPPLELGPGSNRVTASLLPADPLVIDDMRYQSLRRPEARAVLIVLGGGSRGGDDLFVRAALETIGTHDIETTTIGIAELDEQTLADYSLVIATDLGVVGPADAGQLVDYVRAGGGLFAAAGPRSNGLSAMPVTDHALTAVSFGAPGSTVSVSAVDASHPALRGVEGLRSAKFFRYVGIVPRDTDDVLLEIDSGAPLLLESELGAGRVVLMASTLDREWNDLPVQPAFVPLIAGVANHLLGGGGFNREAELGSTLSVRALGMQGGQIYEPDGEPALGLAGGSGDVVLEHVGFYEVVGGGRTEVVAVNPDAREADFARIEPALIERWQGYGATARAAVAAEQAAQAGPDSLERTPVPFGLWLLWLLIAALLIESVIGNWHLRVRRGVPT